MFSIEPQLRNIPPKKICTSTTSAKLIPRHLSQNEQNPQILAPQASVCVPSIEFIKINFAYYPLSLLLGQRVEMAVTHKSEWTSVNEICGCCVLQASKTQPASSGVSTEGGENKKKKKNRANCVPGWPVSWQTWPRMVYTLRVFKGWWGLMGTGHWNLSKFEFVSIKIV